MTNGSILTYITLIISIISLLVSLFSVIISNKRNKLTKDSFNVARIKGETNKRFWVRTIKRFVEENEEHLKLPNNVNKKDDPEAFDDYLKRKYYILLEMAYSGELKTDNVQEVIELLFQPRIKQSYWTKK